MEVRQSGGGDAAASCGLPNRDGDSVGDRDRSEVISCKAAEAAVMESGGKGELSEAGCMSAAGWSREGWGDGGIGVPAPPPPPGRIL